MSYTFGHADVIKDPYVVAEFERLQAYLRALAKQVPIPPENPDVPRKPPKDEDPDNDTTVGVRWLTGPWIVGFDGEGIATGYPSYSVVGPPRLTGNVNNFAPRGIDSAIVMVIGSTVTPVTMSGIRAGVNALRILAISNESGAVLKLINESSASSENNRFSWGTSAQINETLNIPSGGLVWLIYRPFRKRWGLFGVPDVGTDNLPPSLGGIGAMPPAHWWRATQVVDASMTLVTDGDNPAAYIAASGSSYAASTLGWGATRQTGAVSGNAEGAAAPAGSGVITLFDPVTHFLIRTAASIADVRIWCMLVDTATNNSDSLGGAAGIGVGFRFSTVAGDPGWVGVTRDGASQTVSGLVALIAADTEYHLRIRVLSDVAYFSVNGSEEVSIDTTMPATSTLLRWRVVVVTQAAAAKEITYFRTWQHGVHVPS